MSTTASDLLLALDPAAFAESLGFTPDDWQRAVLRSAAPRLLLNCCRQSGKSTVAALLALHTILYRPGSLVLLVSASQRQSLELARTVRTWLAKVQPAPALTEDNAFSLAVAGGGRVVSLPDSESTIRGFAGVDLIVEDEASRVSDELHVAVRPMLAVSGGRLILSSTPFGQRGHFYEAWTSGHGWQRWEVPAGRCPRISPEFLAAERAAMGKLFYRQEYECSFEANAAGVFDLAQVRAAIVHDDAPLVFEWEEEENAN